MESQEKQGTHDKVQQARALASMESDSESARGRVVNANEAYTFVMERHLHGEQVLPRRKLDGLEQYLIYRMRGRSFPIAWVERVIVEYLEDSDE
jgi:hypothetical protein